MLLIVAAALWRSTVSTGWASLALAVALGIYTASLLPRLFDSLDPTMLADRLTDRTVRELLDIARANPRNPDSLMKPVAKRGLEIASGVAVQGITSNDRAVVRSGFAGMRRVLVTYVEGSPTRGWDTEIINLAFQHLREDVGRCVKASPVLILPAALEELTALGVEVQRTLEEDGPEAVSGRLNGVFFDVVLDTLANDASAAAAMATSGIGESARALIHARSPNMVADHIRRLREIALGSMGAEKDHVAGQAHVDLSKLAVGLASMTSRDVMPPSLYQDACSAFADSVDAFVQRASTKAGLANDWAWNWVTMPWAENNLARVVVAGVVADGRGRDHHRGDFGHGANSLVHSLVKLATHGTGGFSTQAHAVETAYSAVLGSMALGVEARSPDLLPEMWITVVRRLVDPGKETLHEVEMLSGLLIAGVYEDESSRPTAARMRKGLKEGLELTVAIPDEWHRRRRARAWLGAGRAALGCGDDAFAEAIAKGIAPDLAKLRSTADGRPWQEPDDYFNGVFAAAQAMPLPSLPDSHTRPDVVAAFEALLNKHQRRRRPRRQPKQPPPSE